MLADLYVRFKTAEEAPGQFLAVRSAIVNLFDAYPTLDGTIGVEDVGIQARTDLLQDTPGDNPNFVIQTLAVTVAQRVTAKF
jgi:hypothetical protein